MKIVFRPEAADEMVLAREWYEANSPGLGFELERAVDAALAALTRHPAAHPNVDEGCRRFILRRFP